jgi:hexosaminidase
LYCCYEISEKVQSDTVIEVWKMQDYQNELAKITAAGYRALLSSPWYLSRIAYGADWKLFYVCDPWAFNGN